MRQAGILAAACHYALDHHVVRLVEDHARAAHIGSVLERLPYVAEVMPVETNIVIFTLAGELQAAPFLERMKSAGLLAAAFGPNMVRMVLHLDVNDTDVEKTVAALQAFH